MSPTFTKTALKISKKITELEFFGIDIDLFFIKSHFQVKK